MRREVARPIVASVDSRKTPERRSDARKRRRFPRLFTPSAEKSREKVQHRSRDRDRFCGSDTPTVREPFFSREPRSPFLPRALSPRTCTTLHTLERSRARYASQLSERAPEPVFSRVSLARSETSETGVGPNRESRADPTFRAPISWILERSPLIPPMASAAVEKDLAAQVVMQNMVRARDFSSVRGLAGAIPRRVEP